MLANAGRTALRPPPPDPRTRVTPGQLYRLLSAALREERRSCCRCRMPMVCARAGVPGTGANWHLEPHRPCAECGPLVAALVSRYAEAYDMRA